MKTRKFFALLLALCLLVGCLPLSASADPASSPTPAPTPHPDTENPYDWGSTWDDPSNNIDVPDQPGIVNPGGGWTPPPGYYDDGGLGWEDGGIYDPNFVPSDDPWGGGTGPDGDDSGLGWDPFADTFTDVKSSDYFCNAVQWAVKKGITSGTSTTTFSPNAPCTRGQAVTFLWRAAGKPEPANSGTSFGDVKSGAYYEKAVQWAVENGITSGTGNGKFSPEATCTRAQIVTFMYRAENSPAVSEGSSFSDVASTAYYKDAVQWAAENEITSGTGNGKFSPENKCVRGQIVTFLYRYSGE